MTSHDIILPPQAASSGITRSKAAAFVPLAIALFGVAAVLFGGVSARMNGSETASLRQIDPSLEPLHGEERYKQIVREAEARLAREAEATPAKSASGEATSSSPK